MDGAVVHGVDGTLKCMLSRPLLIRIPLLLAVLLTSACSTVSYYSQAIGGHLRLMQSRESIEKLLSSEDTDETLRQQLQTLVDARVYAVEELGLPDNDSYSSYAATGRDAVTWNVVAAEEFSLVPQTWCFPVAGCVSYRGYFDRKDAQRYADTLKDKNFDVTIGGASAYSTLGWFDDPVLDTMLRGGDIRFVGTLFHELAHQVLYVKDDSNFNEAFATFVEQHGTRRWLNSRGESARIGAYDAYLQRNEDFVKLLQTTRAELETLYQQSLEESAKREAKQAVFDGMRENYVALKDSWDSYSGYDNWFSRDLNNARLLAVATYQRYVPAFAAMYVEAGEDLDAFYALAKEVSELPSEERTRRMDAYLDDVSVDGSAS